MAYPSVTTILPRTVVAASDPESAKMSDRSSMSPPGRYTAGAVTPSGGVARAKDGGFAWTVRSASGRLTDEPRGSDRYSSGSWTSYSIPSASSSATM